MKTPLPSVRVERRADGSMIARSLLTLPPAAQSLPHLFEESALAHPQRVFMRQRTVPSGEWVAMKYGEALDRVRSIAQWFLDRGARKGEVLAILSGPSIQHSLMMLGAQMCGMAVAPLSAPYSLASRDHAKLRRCIAQCGASYVFADDGRAFGGAFSAMAGDNPQLCFIANGETSVGFDVIPMQSLLQTVPTPAVATAMNELTHESVARLMFTSGSTGSPKAVPQRQACLVVTVAQCEALGLLDFDGVGPQHLEAMPFSHIMAGNFNFNNVVRAAGTIHIDDGKPTPQLFHHTLANLREVSPHFFITVPVGFAMLCDVMEADPELRDKFFENLRYLGFGGAVMSDHVHARLQALAQRARGEFVPIYSFYGATEYLFGSMQYWGSERTDVIGLPVPGTQLKLTPLDGKFELCVRGPTLMSKSGYVGASTPADQLFDEEGFFRTGDAVKWFDAQRPEMGLVFDGRIAEDFKLSSGTWVSVAALRTDIVSACDPLVREAVICGLNREWLSLLLWLNETAVRKYLGAEGDTLSGTQLAAHPRVRRALKEAIEKHNTANPGSARRIKRALIITEPLSYDAGEVTDKGNANQHVVRTRRAVEVTRLCEPFAVPPLDLLDMESP